MLVFVRRGLRVLRGGAGMAVVLRVLPLSFVREWGERWVGWCGVREEKKKRAEGEREARFVRRVFFGVG